MALNFGSPSGITYGTGVYGQSVSAGTASRANVIPNATQFTVDLRAKALAGPIIVALGQSDAFWIGVLSGVKAFAQVGSGGAVVDLSSPTDVLGDGNFHAIRLSAGPSGCVLMVDGAVVASSATTPTAAGVALTGTLGLRNLGGSFGWVGDVDEVAIYSVEMPGAYTPGPVSNSAANLVAVWHLDGDLTDSAASGTPPGLATETDTALALAAKQIKPTGLATETDTALALTTAAGFDFHSAAGLIFGDLAGALTSLARQAAVNMVLRVYAVASPGSLVHESGTLTTGSNGRLPRFTHSSLSLGTNYHCMLIRASDGEIVSVKLPAT